VKKYKAIIKIMVVPAIVGTTLFFSSCKRDTSLIDNFTNLKQTPGVTAYNSEVDYTENGILKIKVSSPRTVYYQFAEEPYTEFPDGIAVFTYSDSLTVETTLTAKYAIYNEKTMIWHAKNNIVAKNRKGEVLYTEELFWDQKKHIIYTDANVKINSVNGLVYGRKGLISDETFDHWEVKEPYNGEISL